MLDLDKRSITYLPGVGPMKADILQKEAGISSYEDLLFYFPYKYIDRSRFYKVAEISGNMPYIQLKGQILYFDTLGEGRSKRLVGKFSDGTGTIDLVWFKGLNYVTDKYRPNTEYIVFGKPTEFGHTYNIPHPDIDSMEQADQVANGLTPFYNTSEKMKKSFLNSRAIQNLQYTLLSWLNWELPETLSPDVLKRIHMMSMTEAMRNIHFPESAAKLRDAQLRLKFDELFFIQLNILRTASVRKLKLKGIIFPTVGHYFNTFYKEYLPFELTNAQKRVVREIRADMGSGRQMNRLLQGDVGSGKTTVLITKVMYLHYEKQIPYEQMVILTFTNKAADEIKERLYALEPEIAEEQLWGFGTFHSVCLTMLKKMLPVENLGYTKEFMVMDPDEELGMAEQLILTYQLKIKYKNRLKKRLEQKNSKYQDDIEKLKALLKEEKRRQDKMTFDELLENTCKLVKMSAEIEEVSKKNANLQDNENTGMQDISWIIVDEVQDSDEKQLELIDCLKKPQTCFFAVGDPNQVIYSWR